MAQDKHITASSSSSSSASLSPTAASAENLLPEDSSSHRGNMNGYSNPVGPDIFSGPSSPPPTYQHVLEQTRLGKCLKKQASVESEDNLPIMTDNKYTTLQGCTNDGYQDHQEPSTSYDASSRQFDESSSVTTLTMCQDDDDDDEEEDDNQDRYNEESNDDEEDCDTDAETLDERKLDHDERYTCKLDTRPPDIIEVANKTSKEMYLAMAKEMGIECRMSDQCRCLDCQGGYLDCADEHMKTDGGLGAGTPMFVSEAFGHGMAPACVIL